MHEAKAEIVANVWKLIASPGDEVGAGDVIAVLETMKMEIPVIAPVSGSVSEVRVTQGQIVQEGDVIAVID
ncbi:biotin/lipoyl-binding carrier protein [Aeromicrobium sp.]|jgi:biotin carboxyl carrier protein|uniref:biotin/lipoyl-binding carrier protein n=1 Tax=Aeromicrobium sp. TaxID=1871063 RepID=UPI003C65D39F